MTKTTLNLALSDENPTVLKKVSLNYLDLCRYVSCVLIGWEKVGQTQQPIRSGLLSHCKHSHDSCKHGSQDTLFAEKTPSSWNIMRYWLIILWVSSTMSSMNVGYVIQWPMSGNNAALFQERMILSDDHFHDNRHWLVVILLFSKFSLSFST